MNCNPLVRTIYNHGNKVVQILILAQPVFMFKGLGEVGYL
jgi:hypothetical protein